MFFEYNEREIEYLKKKDKKLSVVIEEVGHIYREVEPDLFTSLVNSIIGQQISTKAQISIRNRVKESLGEITPEKIDTLSDEDLRNFGMSFRKASYIKNIAKKIINEELDINSLSQKTDDEICTELVKLNGVGVWTAEMMMIFSMQRPNILSFGDLAIQRGLRMIYHHKEISRELFEKYRKRYSPCCTVASLYIWSVAGGQMETMKDYGITTKK